MCIRDSAVYRPQEGLPVLIRHSYGLWLPVRASLACSSLHSLPDWRLVTGYYGRIRLPVWLRGVLLVVEHPYPLGPRSISRLNCLSRRRILLAAHAFALCMLPASRSVPSSLGTPAPVLV